MKRNQTGVTLIELLIVAALIGILGAIAVPAYRDYVIRGKLTDAHSILSGTRVRMEQYYQDNKSYPTWCGGAAGLAAFTAPASTQYFSFTCAAGATAGQNYTMSATGIAGGGTGGFTYTITEANVRATTAVPTGWTTSATCWVIKKNGSC
ncbi:MAG: prepilin-type N-terminal cleavage/methylation domain-containing protein [Burkholderiales bacterium]|nr:prepilin-type N-terminal cleavage/methylation domain-containing protein [Burkholderiales bacterium]